LVGRPPTPKGSVWTWREGGREREREREMDILARDYPTLLEIDRGERLAACCSAGPAPV